MTPARDRARPPPGAHLQAELSRPIGWKLPTLALLATVGVMAVPMVLIPPSEAGRDFRRDRAAVDAAGSAPAGVETLAWSQLVPAGWDASDQVRALRAQPTGMRDDDPRARASLALLRQVLDAAPGNPALAGRHVRLPGYVVPLDRRGDRVASFLLVPYFGACIHTPPPPANQIVHVVLAAPREGLQSMEAVWVQGMLHVARQDNDIAVSTYRLDAASTEPYP